MKTQGLQHTLFSKIPLMAVSILFYSNCYFNPAIQSVINPATSESGGAGALALLAGGGSSVSADTSATLQVLGQLKISSGSVANASLSLGSVSSSAKDTVAVTTTTTTNAIGKFLLKLRPGTYTINVTSSGGASLGSFSLVVTSSSATQVVPDATFTVLGLTTYTIDQTVALTTDFTLVSTSPADGDQSVPLLGSTFTIAFTFSNTVDASTITGGNISFIIGTPEAAKSISHTTVGNTSIITFGGGNIYVGMNYKITPTSAIKDTDGFFLTPKTINIKTANMAL
ncbi:Ig-like domain-containing protein [Leptospira sp. 'Mane']|uniref:Ig-like domain-containing protein n=1 Tax=Leptospira sp. 'Mane' TaxID=3387407 RepID=UPI00398BA544